MASNISDKKEQPQPLSFNSQNLCDSNDVGNSNQGSNFDTIQRDSLNAVRTGVDQDDMSKIDFQTIKAANATLKRNQKIELSRSDLLKLLSYLEGELQAREVVVAALKSEKVKQYLQSTRYNPLSLNDPNAALFRDTLACTGNITSKQSSIMAAQSEQEIRLLADHHLETLENVIMQQRQTQIRMINALHETEEKHKKLFIELEEEKRKHERDTAQGDDIAYGLELERTKLRQDLENEKALRKKTEKDMKKLQETLDNERSRQKQIVLLLLAERKKIIMKYVEERKRSEDLAQILSEEKQRVDTIAEGLEEESKKSLRMEAELEKQINSFEIERKNLKSNIMKEENIIKELEMEIKELRSENENLRKPNRMSQTTNSPKMIMSTTVRSDGIDESGTSGTPMISSVAKIIQPTATVSSVPVSGPTTGIARSISPGQTLRQTSANELNTFNLTKVPARKLSNSSNNPPVGVTLAGAVVQSIGSTYSNSPVPIQNNIKSNIPSNHQSTQPTIKKVLIPVMGRGVPPPIPPNKPVIPPKRESSISRIGFSNKDKDVHQTGTGGNTLMSTETVEDDAQDFQQVLCKNNY